MTTETRTTGLELVEGARLRSALHELSQPVTTLECILSMQKLLAEKTKSGEIAAQQVCETMRDALHECERMMRVMNTMRDCLETRIGSA